MQARSHWFKHPRHSASEHNNEKTSSAKVIIHTLFDEDIAYATSVKFERGSADANLSVRCICSDL